MSELDSAIRARGRAFFEAISNREPSLFSKDRWTGQVMEWAMANDAFKTRLLRFVDVFPALRTPEALTGHIREHFGDEEGGDVPATMRLGAKGANLGGRVGAAVLDKTIRYQIEQMAHQFIIGETAEAAVESIGRLRREGFTEVVDLLGEAAVSEKEAEDYVGRYVDLVDRLAEAYGGEGPDWGVSPRIQITVKPTALYSQARAMDFEASVEIIAGRMERIFRRVVAVGGLLCVDMESYEYKDITLEAFRRLRERFPDYPHLGIALQAYLRDSHDDLVRLLEWMREKGLPCEVRLVKGAYWDYETVAARQHGWEDRVYQEKWRTDANFERCTATALAAHDVCYFACGSHNVRSICATLELARALEVPEDRYEFQVLYGMAEPVRRALLEETGRVRLYCPYGELVPGMAYLVRRLLENTSNESFLRQSFVEGREMEALLRDPAAGEAEAEGETLSDSAREEEAESRFENEPAADFTQAGQRRAYAEAIRTFREESLGRTHPLSIGGEEVFTEDVADSTNPNRPGEIVGRVCQAGTDEVERAIVAARDAFPAWRDADADERADCLVRAAAVCRERIFEFAACQTLEVGKQWDQAYADVTEAIDFMEYYARHVRRLARPSKQGHHPGEENRYFYRPKGVAAVIAPWNFPLAIAAGMTSAALAAGNPVVFKPSGLSSVIGHQLVDAYRRAGVPAGVFNCVPGRSSVMGDSLVDHPDVALIGFTGSLDVGRRILERAAVVQPGQRHVKKVVAEMGGKNAIIVDDDADLDEAVPAVLHSAFGFQGQKCSACSRVIVLDAVHERFVQRLREGAASWKIGPPEDPGNRMGAVVDAAARDEILGYVDLARSEGEILFQGETPDDAGFHVPMTIVGGIGPEHRLAQEEIFGPVLSVMRAPDFDAALAIANDTPFALTGGLFSRSPAHLDRARREFEVGNLYLNRGITGSIVGRQAFGGMRLSGIGSKAGGPDYLLQFLDPCVVTENTTRRGFTPGIG